MKLQSLKCPNCDAALEIEDGIDTFFCKYCGYKIVLTDMSDASYNAKVQVKQMEHQEKLRDKEYAQERYKMEFKQKDERHTFLIVFGILGAIILMCAIIGFFGDAGAEKQEEELQALVEEIMVDIENGDFDEAYIKANSLYWDDSWTSEGEEKWEETRKEVINQIIEAEIEATGQSSHEPEKDSWLDGWFD